MREEKWIEFELKSFSLRWFYISASGPTKDFSQFMLPVCLVCFCHHSMFCFFYIRPTKDCMLMKIFFKSNYFFVFVFSKHDKGSWFCWNAKGFFLEVKLKIFFNNSFSKKMLSEKLLRFYIKPFVNYTKYIFAIWALL